MYPNCGFVIFSGLYRLISAQISGLLVDFYKIFDQSSHILETNVINITILLGGIIYLGSNALSASLSKRQQKIVGAIQEAEERLQQAINRLNKSEIQSDQAEIVSDSIKTYAEKTAVQVKSDILNDGKVEIERLTSSVKSQITTIEAKVRKQISDYVVTLALKRLTLQLEGNLNYLEEPRMHSEI
jgi:F0F1-type ATP synthase membrane subunit b/b'